jgi:hypothetical protein
VKYVTGSHFRAETWFLLFGALSKVVLGTFGPFIQCVPGVKRLESEIEKLWGFASTLGGVVRRQKGKCDRKRCEVIKLYFVFQIFEGLSYSTKICEPGLD